MNDTNEMAESESIVLGKFLAMSPHIASAAIAATSTHFIEHTHTHTNTHHNGQMNERTNGHTRTHTYKMPSG